MFLVPAGALYVLPSVTREFLGREIRAIRVRLVSLPRASIDARLRLDVLHFVGQRESVHRTGIERHLALRIHPRQRVFHPVLIIPLWIVFAGMSATAFSTVERALDGRHR